MAWKRRAPEPSEARGGEGDELTTWQNDFFTVGSDDVVVRVTRNDRPFPSVAQMASTMDELNHQLDSVGRRGRRLLVDTRAARPRNDKEFEEAFAPHRQRMMGGFDRNAVLVETVVGRLQVNRHARADGTDTRAFIDEDEALRWLKS